MAEILPFRGFIYNPEKISDLSLVASPPYDIISKKAGPGYYSKHPYNIIRLELGDESAREESGPNRYLLSAKYLKEWQEQGVLIREEKPAFYFYQIEFSVGEKERRIRKGFIGLCRLEEFGEGMVFPHERIHQKQKEDRLIALKSYQANISPIFSLYSDPDQTINTLFEESISQPPLFDFTSEDNSHHKVWSIKDRDLLHSVCKTMKTRGLFIADGHHRYEAALAYKKENERAGGSLTGKEGFNYVMMYFCPFEDEGLTILPSHRLIFNLERFDRTAFDSELSKYFIKTDYAFDSGNEPFRKAEFLNALEKEGKRGNAFGLYIHDNNYYTLLFFKREPSLSSIVGKDIPPVLQRLDVTILHQFILERLLGLREEDQNGNRIRIIKNHNRALDLVKEGSFQMVFLMNPPKIGEVKEVALEGKFMPQKSTFFYPKVPTGLVINLIR